MEQGGGEVGGGHSAGSEDLVRPQQGPQHW
jgi:hypothetical protein